MNKALIKNKNILITGGTGSIGERILDTIIDASPKLVKIFSRNEYKQYQLRYKYAGKKNIQFIIGDVRDQQPVMEVVKNTDLIFHCAALKHVPFSEELPEEFIKTNILGSLNVMKAALTYKVPKTISISTDKVVDPANLMGMTKAVQEKIFASHFLKREKYGTSFVNVRFGNVTGTRGSLFPIIYHQIMSNKPVTITHPEMTRFFISPDEAIELILWAADRGKNGDTIIRKMKSCKIIDIVETFLEVLDKKPSKKTINYIGIRPGEKIHEALVTEDNAYRLIQKDNYYVVKPYQAAEGAVNKKLKSISMEGFYSNNTQNFMSKKELTKYIKTFLDEHEKRNHII
jgi:FlaA1/EpsC-like NDP-sugar epimerase